MRILCFGDSNTYGFDPRSCLGDRYPAEIRWPERLAAVSGWQGRNVGLNGREIPHRPRRRCRPGWSVFWSTWETRRFS